jgi:hypothetical protein
MPTLREQAGSCSLRPESTAVRIPPSEPSYKPIPITLSSRLSIILMDSSLVTYFGRNLLRFPSKDLGQTSDTVS